MNHPTPEDMEWLGARYNELARAMKDMRESRDRWARRAKIAEKALEDVLYANNMVQARHIVEGVLGG